jgi:hypothetical protein
MKPLTKEQHDTIVAWMKDKCDYMIQEFSKDFQTCEIDPRLSAFQVFTEAYDESKAKVDKIVKENSFKTNCIEPRSVIQHKPINT